MSKLIAGKEDAPLIRYSDFGIFNTFKNRNDSQDLGSVANGI